MRGSPGARGSSRSPRSHTDTLIDLESLRLARTARVRGTASTSPPRARSWSWTGSRRRPSGPAAPLFRACCRVVPRLVQDLERGDGRRQHLHVLAGRPDDLAHRRPRGRLHAVAARRGAADGARRRLRDRQPCQNVLRPGELLRSIRLPGSRAREARRLPPRHAHPPRAIGRAAHRDRGAEGRRPPAHRHGRDRPAGAAPLRARSRPAPSCATRSTPRSPHGTTSTTCTARRRTAHI